MLVCGGTDWALIGRSKDVRPEYPNLDVPHRIKNMEVRPPCDMFCRHQLEQRSRVRHTTPGAPAIPLQLGLRGRDIGQ